MKTLTAQQKQGLAALEKLTGFIPPRQAACVRDLIRTSEESDYLIGKAISLAAAVDAMPATYEQDSKGDEAIIHLHYFYGSCDWWIIEKDKGHPSDGPEDFQCQAFGIADLGYGAEFGYISLPEIFSAAPMANLDFHFQPITVAQWKAKRLLSDRSAIIPAAPPAAPIRTAPILPLPADTKAQTNIPGAWDRLMSLSD